MKALIFLKPFRENMRKPLAVISDKNLIRRFEKNGRFTIYNNLSTRGQVVIKKQNCLEVDLPEHAVKSLAFSDILIEYFKKQKLHKFDINNYPEIFL